MKLSFACLILVAATPSVEAFSQPWRHSQSVGRMSTITLRPASVQEDTAASEAKPAAEDVNEIEEIKIGSMEKELLAEMEKETDKIVSEMMDENCDVDYDTDVVDELCVEDSEARTRFRDRLRNIIRTTIEVVRGTDVKDSEGLSEGEVLEKGWEQRANASSLARNAEVWKFGLKAAFSVLGARKVKLKGGSDEELREAQTKAAEYIRDNLLKLGPSFVKLGQVLSTRTGKPSLNVC